MAALTAAHGGRVELDTQTGSGATFRVPLPITPKGDGAPPGRAEDAEARAR